MVKVNKDMLISEVLKLDMRVAPIFMEFGMHCIGCPMSQAESIEAACMTHGVDVNKIVDNLNEFFEENTI